MDALEKQLEGVSASTGQDVDKLKFLLCCLLAFPLAVLFRFIPSRILKEIFVTVVGFSFGYICFGNDVAHSFAMSMVVYLLAMFAPKGSAHKIILVWCMGYIVVNHIRRMYTDYLGWKMDFTSAQMILCIKMIMFGFDLEDGSKPVDSLSKTQIASKIDKLPSLLSFFGYAYFFPGFLAGPGIGFAEYDSFMSGSMFKGGKVPWGIFAFIKCIFVVILSGVALTISGTYFPMAVARTDEFFETTTLSYRLFYFWFACGISRSVYYFAWKFAEGSFILIGLGYNGEDESGNTKYNRAENVRILSVELAPNFRGVANNWNIRTDHWLKNYIYLRLQGTSMEKYNVALTFLASAVWHGLYPGYYLSFATASLCISLARNIRKKIRPMFMKNETEGKSTKWIYDVVTILTTNYMLNFTFLPFTMLDLQSSLRVWSSIYFSGHVLFVVAFVGLYFVPSPKRKTT